MLTESSSWSRLSDVSTVINKKWVYKSNWSFFLRWRNFCALCDDEGKLCVFKMVFVCFLAFKMCFIFYFFVLWNKCEIILWITVFFHHSAVIRVLLALVCAVIFHIAQLVAQLFTSSLELHKEIFICWWKSFHIINEKEQSFFQSLLRILWLLNSLFLTITCIIKQVRLVCILGVLVNVV